MDKEALVRTRNQVVELKVFYQILHVLTKLLNGKS